MSELSNEEKIRNRATEVFGSEEKAEDWLEKYSKTLGGTPKEVGKTNAGCEAVMQHLHRTEILLFKMD